MKTAENDRKQHKEESLLGGVVEHYQELTSKMTVYAIIDMQDDDIAGRLVLEYESRKKKEECSPLRIIFLLTDSEGHIAEAVNLPSPNEESCPFARMATAVRELTDKISGSLEARGIRIHFAQPDSPDFLDILEAFDECESHPYRTMPIIY